LPTDRTQSTIVDLNSFESISNAHFRGCASPTTQKGTTPLSLPVKE